MSIAAELGWTVEPLYPSLGARVVGPDLAADLTKAVADGLRELLYEHLVLALPGQRLSRERHVEVGTIFGDPYLHPFLEAVEGHPAILQVIKEADETHTFGGEFWHADITFSDPPAAVSLLYAHEVPPTGGDTLFANQFMAFSHLSPGYQELLEQLTAVHLYPDMDEDTPGTTARHRVVRTHPASGHKAIYVNSAFVSRFDGMTEAESAPILDYLFAHQVRPEFCARVPWTDNQLTLWDNRAVLHYAMNDYHGRRRHLERVTVLEREH